MRHSAPTVPEASVYRKSDTYKDSAKRKRLDDSLAEDDVQGHDERQDREVPEGDNIVDEEDGSHAEQKLSSQVMEVSSLLEAAKTFFMDAMTAFEDRLVQLHQKQMDKWEQEIELLRSMDAINEDMSFRLADARATISLVRPGSVQPTDSMA